MQITNRRTAFERGGVVGNMVAIQREVMRTGLRADRQSFGLRPPRHVHAQTAGHVQNMRAAAGACHQPYDLARRVRLAFGRARCRFNSVRNSRGFCCRVSRPFRWFGTVSSMPNPPDMRCWLCGVSCFCHGRSSPDGGSRCQEAPPLPVMDAFQCLRHLKFFIRRDSCRRPNLVKPGKQGAASSGERMRRVRMYCREGR